MSKYADTRHHNFLRTAVIVPQVFLANPISGIDKATKAVQNNAQAHLKEIKATYKQGAQYIIAPELGLTGYSCGDLFHSEVLLDAALDALKWLINETRKMNVVISVGLPLVVDGAVYNCCVTFYRGTILAVTPKSYPPNNSEYYEDRWFASAYDARVNQIRLLNQPTPFGNDILVRFSNYPLFVLYNTVCEDDWVTVPPANLAVLAGATVQGNLSASNITIGKSSYRHKMISFYSASRLSVVLYSAAGQGESTSDVAWDGDAFIAEYGEILAKTKRFIRGGSHIIADVDLLLIQQVRMRQTSFRHNATVMNPQFRSVQVEGTLGVDNPKVYQKLIRTINKHPFVPSDPATLNDLCEEVFMIQSSGLIQRLLSLPKSMRRIYIGLSGGVDSTISLLTAVRAMDELGLPRSRIQAYTMPGFGTHDRTLNNALDLAKALGVPIKKLPIKGLATHLMYNADIPLKIGTKEATIVRDQLLTALQQLPQDDETETAKALLDALFSPANFDYLLPLEANVSFENAQAWARFMTLLINAAEGKGIVLGTGDLTEIMLGWCTMFADHSSHYNPNSGTPKTLVCFVIGWAAQNIFAAEAKVVAVLRDILKTPFSPELLPRLADQISQLTEDILGPLELHDFFGYYFWRFGFGPVRVSRMALHAFAGQYSLAEIKRVMRIHLTRFFANQYKRNCVPDGLKLGLLALSPRGDWRMPSDAQVNAWIDELERVPESLVI